MDILAQRVLKRFADKHIGKQIIGTVIIQYLQKHYDQTLEGFVRHHIVFVRTNDLALKMRLFQDHASVLAELSRYLLRLGYTYELKGLRFR